LLVLVRIIKNWFYRNFRNG